jgi:excisionase family DNA binding protein
MVTSWKETKMKDLKTTLAPPETPPTIMSVNQAAAFLQLHPKTVLDLLHRKRIVGTRIGRMWRVHREELEDFVRKPLAGEKKSAGTKRKGARKPGKG